MSEYDDITARAARALQAIGAWVETPAPPRATNAEDVLTPHERAAIASGRMGPEAVRLTVEVAGLRATVAELLERVERLERGALVSDDTRRAIDGAGAVE